MKTRESFGCRLLWWMVALVVSAAVGCGGEPTDDDDDSVVADDDDSAGSPECPPGTLLDPDLPPDLLPSFPDGCVPEACGVGRWGDLDVAAASIFVDAAAEPGGDGSQTAPLTSIQAGVDAAGAATVAVAAGVYLENLSLDEDHAGIQVAGRCPELVIVDGSGGEENDPTLLADGFMGDEIWTLSGITVTGGPKHGGKVDVGRLEFQSSIVTGNTKIGILATGSASTLVLTNVDVLDTAPNDNGNWGRGLAIEGGATLLATDSRVEGNTEFGVSVTSGSSATLTRVEVRDTWFAAGESFGTGVHAQENSSIELVDCLFEDNDSHAIFGGDNTEVTLSGTEVYGDTQGGERGRRGVHVQDDAILVASDCIIDGTAETGIMVANGSTATLTDLQVSRTRPGMLPVPWGVGLHLEGENTVAVEDCVFEANEGAGVHVNGESTLTLTRVDILETRAYLDGSRGRGIEVQGGATIHAEDVLVEEAVETALFASNEGTTVTFDGVTVRGTKRGTTMTTAAGLVTQTGVSLIATNLVVEDTDGPALAVLGASSVSCTSCEFSDSTFAGAVVWGGSSLELISTAIERTSPDASQGGGIGIYATDQYDGSVSLRVEDCTIEDQPYAAIWLWGPGSYDVRDSTLSGGYGFEMSLPGGEVLLLHGDGVVASGGVGMWDGAQGLILEGNEIRDAYRFGVLLNGSSAWLEGNGFADNATDLVWQDCEEVDEPQGLDGVPVLDLCPVYNEPVAPLVFEFLVVEPDPLS